MSASQTIGSFINPPYGAQDDLNLISNMLNTPNSFTVSQNFNGITDSGDLTVSGSATVGALVCTGAATFSGSVSGITGTTGPTGPAGATGATGPTGPAGTVSGLAVTNSDSSSTFYPVFCSATGTNVSLAVDSVVGPLSYVPSTSTLTASNFSSSTAAALTIQSAAGQPINLKTNGGVQNGLSIASTGALSIYNNITLPTTYTAVTTGQLGSTTTMTGGTSISLATGTYYSYTTTNAPLPAGVYYCDITIPITLNVSSSGGQYINNVEVGFGTTTAFFANASEKVMQFISPTPATYNIPFDAIGRFIYTFTAPTQIVLGVKASWIKITLTTIANTWQANFTRIA